MEEVNGLHAQLKTSLSSFAEEIDKQVALLTTKETAREKYIKIDEGHLSKVKKDVVLNIGGKKFRTSKSKLLSVENTLFYAMLLVANGLVKTVIVNFSAY